MTTSLNATGTSLNQLHYTVFGSAPTLSQLNSYAGDYQALITKGSSASAARNEIASKMLATTAAVDKLLPNLSSANYQATTILKNLGITNTNIIAFVEKALDGTGGYGQYSLTTAVTFLSDYVANYKKGALTDPVWDAALVAGNAVIIGITPPSAPPAPVPTFTVNTDSLMGTAADETFVAAAGTWTAGDKVDGGAGNDTLNLTLTGTAAAGTISGIEAVNITATPNPATIDMSGVAGVTQINNVSSANGASLTVNNVAAAVSTTITGGNSATTINYGTAVTAATATTDAATVTLAGVSAGSSFVTAGVETLTLNSTTAANTLTTLTDTGITKLVIGGDKALTITNAVGGATIGSIDASALKAALTMTAGAGAGGTAATGVTVTGPTDAAATLNLTTGANRDTITTGAGKATVVAGAGNDTITVGGGDALITPGAGNDVLTLGAGAETIRFDAAAAAANVDTISNFDTAKDVLAFNLGTALAAATTTSAATTAAGVFGVVQTGALSPTLATVAGTGTGTTHSFVSVAAGSTVANTIPQTATAVALNGVFSDGTAAGVVTALGTTGTTGVTTTTGGSFLLATYSVGNIAQIWSYNGDSTANTDIDAAELSLVATMTGVPMGGLTAANFATYLASGAAVTTTTAGTGQSVNLTLPLNFVTSNANANGHFLTGANDTVTVAVGALPTAAATSTTGLTVVDPSSTDADTLSATVLAAAWDAGTIISSIETVTLNMLAADATGFDASATLPGSSAINFSGTQSVGSPAAATAVTGLTSGTAIGFAQDSAGVGYSGTVRVNNTGTLAALTLNLAGNTATSSTSSAAAPTFNLDSVVTALTVNVNGSGGLNVDPDTGSAGAATTNRIFGPAANGAVAATLAGTGNLTLFGPAGNFDTGVLTGNAAAYTGALTLVPTTAAAMDFSATGVVTGIRTIDLTNVPTFAAGNTITFAAANNSTAYGSGPITISFAPAVASAGALTGLTANMDGVASQTDALTVSLGANATGVTNGVAAGNFETLLVSSAAVSGTGITLGALALNNGPGTQTVRVTGAGNFTIGAVTADVIDTTGVTGTVTFGANTFGNTAGSVFNGGIGATTVTGSVGADILTTGVGADSVAGGGGADQISTGSGNDTVDGGDGSDLIFLGSGTDVVYFTGSTALTSAGGNADTVTGFGNTGGSGGDKIAFGSTFLGAAIGSGGYSAIGSGTANGLSANTGQIILVSDNLTGASGSAAIATLVGGTSGFSVAGNQRAVIVADDGSNAYIWYVNDNLDTTVGDVSASDIVLIGTLVGTDIAAFTSANFLAAV